MFKLNLATISLALLTLGGAESLRTSDAIGTGPTARGFAHRRHAGTEARSIPDGDRRGVLLGPIFTENDGKPLGTVLLRLDIRHPATGDLDIHLAYDADGDGAAETRAPIEFFRSRPEPDAAETYACPASLNGTYFFRDGDGDEDVFDCFSGLPSGHAFYLAVADTLAQDVGRVADWSVSRADPVVAQK